MANESHLLWTFSTNLWVEQVSAADKSLRLPPVTIHSINGSGAFLAIDGNSLVESFLINIEHVESKP